MDLPRVNPVGIVELPRGYSTRARAYPRALRIATVLVLAAFVLVGVTTTVESLGVYCLTSYGGILFD